MRGAKVKVQCKRCGKPFDARVADRKRGWGIYCSKTCKAIQQERQTHQYADYLSRLNSDDSLDGYGLFDGFDITDRDWGASDGGDTYDR